MFIVRATIQLMALFVLFVGAIFLVDKAYADEYVGVSQNITTDFNGDKLHHLFASGIYYRVNSECDVPDYATVVLVDSGFYGTGSIHYSGGVQSKVYWKVETTTINNCTRDCNDEAITTNTTHWHNCDVTGVIGGIPRIAECEDNNPIYTADTEMLFLKNIKIYEGLDDTHLMLNRAVLQHDNGCFEIKVIE